MTRSPPRSRRTTRTKTPGRSKAKRATVVRRRRTPEEAKLEIVEATRRYLLKKSFHTLTIEKLMQATKIGRSAFYAYFNNVYDLAEIFIYEVAAEIEKGAGDWYADRGDPVAQIRAGLLNGIKFWEKNGPMIRGLYEASMQDRRLARIWRDKVALHPINSVAEKIQREQAAGLIGPFDAREMSIALNRFNLTYLNDRLGEGRPRNRDIILQTLERVWIGTLYGKLPAATGKTRAPRPADVSRRKTTAFTGRLAQ